MFNSLYSLCNLFFSKICWRRYHFREKTKESRKKKKRSIINLTKVTQLVGKWGQDYNLD